MRLREAVELSIPQDNLDTAFYTVNDMNTHQYPTMIISGQFQPGQAFATGPIGRIEVETVYEFTTQNMCFPQCKSSGNDVCMSTALQLLQEYPTVTANGDHWAAITEIMKRAGKAAASIGQFAYANKETLIPLGKTFLTMAAAI